MRFSAIIPARNESAHIMQTLEALEYAIQDYSKSTFSGDRNVEIILVDDKSTDSTAQIVSACYDERVRIIHVNEGSCGRSRNRGVAASHGAVLVFVDADTIVPPTIFSEIDAYLQLGKIAGLYSLKSREPGFLGNIWWFFWGLMRSLPLSYSKAMPACSFSTRAHFDDCGGFDEDVAITEEWRIFAALYRRCRSKLQYKTTSRARTSSRRIRGLSTIVRMFIRWSSAVFFPRTRNAYPNCVTKNRPIAPSRIKAARDSILNYVLRILEINSVRIECDGITKRRRFYASVLIKFANAFFFLIGEPLRVLLDDEWIALEMRRFDSLYNVSLNIVGEVKFPILSGVTLRVILLNQNEAFQAKLQAVKIAIKGLAHLHRHPAQHCYAHGDAHAGNILVDFKNDYAFWFDFETKLAGSLLPSEQMAYDLVVFLLSVAEHWPEAPLESILRSIFEERSYRNLSIVNAVASKFDRLMYSPTFFEGVRFYKATGAIKVFSSYCHQMFTETLAVSLSEHAVAPMEQAHDYLHLSVGNRF